MLDNVLNALELDLQKFSSDEKNKIIPVKKRDKSPIERRKSL